MGQLTAQPSTSRARRGRWALLWTPLIGACSLMLDFDELQEGPGATPLDLDSGAMDAGDANGGVANEGGRDSGLGGAVGTSGSDNGGNGGNAGTDNGGDAGIVDSSIPCPEICDDGDPCTDDLCVNGVCEFPAASRIVQYGTEETFTDSEIRRATLISGGDQYFLAVYGNFGGTPNIRFYRTAVDDEAWTAGPAVEDFTDVKEAWTPISPAALVFDNEKSTLEIYFAWGDPSSVNVYSAGFMVRYTSDASLVVGTGSELAAGLNYHFISDTLGPVAAQIEGGAPFVAWPGSAAGTAQTAGIYLQSGDAPLPLASAPKISESGDLRGLAPIAGRSNDTDVGVMGVLWQTQRSNGTQVDTHMQLDGETKQTFAQCLNNGVQGLSVSTSRAPTDGTWLATWSKQQGDEMITETTAVRCSTPTVCAINASCGTAQSQFDGMRNPKTSAYQRTGDSNTIAHQAQVAAHVDPAADSTQIVLKIQRVDLEDRNADTATRELSSLTLAEGPALEGPDWPEVAVIGEDRVAVSWIEYGVGTTNDTLHVNRYQICYAE